MVYVFHGEKLTHPVCASLDHPLRLRRKGGDFKNGAMTND